MTEPITFENLPKAIGKLSLKLEIIEKLLLATRDNQLEEQSDKLLTIEEAAEFLHLTKPTIYSKVSKAELPYMKRSKRLYFSKAELTEYLKKGRKNTTAETLEETHTYLKK